MITEEKPNEMIAWKTVEDSTVKHYGQVRFKQSQQEGTQVNVNMAYTPPAGVAGAAVANLFGVDPKSSMDSDLARMKSLLEEGKTTADSRKVTSDQVMGNNPQNRTGSRNPGQIPNTGTGGNQEQNMTDQDDFVPGLPRDKDQIIPMTGAESDLDEPQDFVQSSYQESVLPPTEETDMDMDEESDHPDNPLE